MIYFKIFLGIDVKFIGLKFLGFFIFFLAMGILFIFVLFLGVFLIFCDLGEIVVNSFKMKVENLFSVL